MNTQTRARLEQSIVTLIFLAGIFVPLLVGIVQTDKTVSVLEKRTLHKRPHFPISVNDAVTFPEKFTEYYSDHFGLREPLSKFAQRIARFQNRGSSSGRWTIGQDNWFFLGSLTPGVNHFGDPFGDFVNINRFTSEQLQQCGMNIEATRQFLAARGISYLYVIAPNKHTIYPDKVPSNAIKQHPESATDQLVNFLQANTQVEVVDLRSPLRAARQHGDVYFRFDTHWNYYGASIAQFEIMKRVNELLPNSKPASQWSLNQFSIETKTGGDLAELARLTPAIERVPVPRFEAGCSPDVRSGRQGRETHTLYCDTGRGKALIFRDSFFTHLQPFMARNFRESTYVWSSITSKALKDQLTTSQPEIVIEEIVERALPYMASRVE